MEHSVSAEKLGEDDLRIMELYGKLLAALYRKGILRGNTAEDIIARYRLRDVAEIPASEDL